jgi:hypothetical protein
MRFFGAMPPRAMWAVAVARCWLGCCCWGWCEAGGGSDGAGARDDDGGGGRAPSCGEGGRPIPSSRPLARGFMSIARLVVVVLVVVLLVVKGKRRRGGGGGGRFDEQLFLTF